MRAHRRRRALPGLTTALFVAVLAAAPSGSPDGAPAPVPRPEPEIRPGAGPAAGKLAGMTVSCPTWGPIWGSPAMAESLAELSELGVEWVAIHPYARVRRDGTVASRPATETDFLARAVELAREAGVELFWKPHLAYWGSFDWRGAIEFGDDEAAWRRFFDGYRTFIVDQAVFAERHGIPLFAVGVETEATTHREAEWRAVVAAVRSVYSGRITYAANWDAIGRVPFWDAVDLVGVQAYFPLAGVGPGAERSQVERAWEPHLATLRALSRTHGGKPVLLTEIGYNRSPDAGRAPWDHRTVDSPEARRLRRILIEVALDRLGEEPVVAGMFWWKWMPGARPRGNFSMRDPEAREALAAAWAKSGGAW